MLNLDRRSLLKLGTLGLGGLAMPGAAQLIAARGFTHNVASGEPRADSVMLWTRCCESFALLSSRTRWHSVSSSLRPTRVSCTATRRR